MAKKRSTTAPRLAAAAATSGGTNPIVSALSGKSDKERSAILEQTHPLFDTHEAQFRLLLDAYEGAGGFLTGEYLWQYSNEKGDSFRQRQEMARYHNYVRALVNIYVRHVFRAGVTREAKALPELEAFWKNVDGAGTPIDGFMKRGAKLALAVGHAGALVDKEPVPATGPSRADDKGKVVASWFEASRIVDWHQRAGELVAVKLREAAPRTSILEEIPDADNCQYLLWQTDAWARFDADGELVNASGGEFHTIGAVPLAMVRPDPSAEHPFLGHALAGNGNVFRALFNRCSEEDQVLRDQAFSLLVVSVDPDKGDVQKAKEQIGTDVGTTSAIVVAGDVDYKTPSMEVPKTLREAIEFLIKEIYRMAHVRFERDSLDAESGDAMRLQFTELNEMLANLAQELESAERQIAKFHYLWTHPGDRVALEQAFEEANVTIAYGREFFVEDLLVELEKWAKAIAMDMGLEFEHYAKKRVLGQLAPDLPSELKDKIHKEIDGQIAHREQALMDAQARFAAGAERLAGGGKKPDGVDGKQQPPPKQDDGQAGAAAA